MTTTTTNEKEAQKPTERKMLTLADLKTLELPTRKHLISPWLKEGESAMVYAPTGVGKSMFTMTLALAVAGGGKAFGWTCPEPRKVLYIDGEMHVQDLQERAILLAQTVEGAPNAEAMGQNLKFYARQYQESEGFLDLAKEEDRKELMKVLDEEGPIDLLILDNLSTLATIADENAASSFEPILKLLMELKRRGVATILVHHTGKTKANTQRKNDFRGSSKLGTTFEVIMGLKPLDDTAGRGVGFSLEWDKYRNKPDERVSPLQVVLSTEDREEGPSWIAVEAEDTVLMQIVRAVQSCQYQQDQDVRKALFPDMDKSTFSKLKTQAIRKGLITDKDWDRCKSEAKENAKLPTVPNTDF